MSKIIGVTVGTNISPQTIAEKLKPVLSVNGAKPNASGDVEVAFNLDELTEEQKAELKGEPGKTPEKGIDYNDGVSPTVSVSKSGKVTTLTIKDASGTKTATINDGSDGDSVSVESVSTSTADGGSNVVTFSDGKTLTVQNGSKGSPGKTPVKGTDYTDGVSPTVTTSKSGKVTTLTIKDASGTKTATINDGSDGAAGKSAYQYATEGGYSGTETEFRQKLAKDIPSVTQGAGESESLVMSQKAVTDLVHDALGESAASYETVDSVDKMTDTSKSYVLSTTGTVWAYGEVTTETEPENVFVPANATLNKRMGSSSDSTQNGHYITEYLEFDGSTASSPIVWLPLNYDPTISDQRIRYCDASKAKLGNIYVNNTVTEAERAYIGQGEDGRYYFDLSKDGNGSTTGLSKHYPSMKYLRISLSSGKTTAITVSDIADVEILFEKDRGTQTESAWYDTGLTPSTGGGNGGGNYVNLLVKVNENKENISELNARVIALENGSNTLTVPSFWQTAVDACISKIKALQVSRNCITFPFFSDNHQRNGYAGVLIAKVMQECHIPYAFFGGDSISNGTIASEAEMIAQDMAFDAHMTYIPNGRFCRAVGNHDGYWYDGTNKYYYGRNQVYELFLREESVAQNKHFGGDGTYYYVDEIASQVRFIVLNTNGGSVDDAQIAWFRDVALNVDEGWAVVVISHQPISNHYHANISNAAAVRAVVTESGAEIIGWFSGHIHRDRIYTGSATNTTDDTQGAAMGFTQVTITSDHTGIAYDDATKHTVANDDQSHAIDFVTINKATRTVHLTRLGIGNDREYSYGDS